MVCHWLKCCYMCVTILIFWKVFFNKNLKKPSTPVSSWQKTLLEDSIQEVKWQKVLPAPLAVYTMEYKFKYEGTNCHQKGLSDNPWLMSFFHNPMVSGFPEIVLVLQNLGLKLQTGPCDLRTRITSGVLPNYLFQESASGFFHPFIFAKLSAIHISSAKD